jgi:formylglycine-generating enzyme required for sulfatase activity
MKPVRILATWRLPILANFLGAVLLFVPVFIQKGNSQSSPCPTWNGLQFVPIPRGDFTMGANYLSDEDAAYGGVAEHSRVGGAFKDELPRHKISVSAFCLMRESLTRTQATMLLAKFKIDERLGSKREDDEKYAAISWRGAQAIAAALSKEIGKKVRLPTEPEWEYAARGGLDSKQFPWGNVSDTFVGVPVRDIVLLARRYCRAGAVQPMIKSAALKRCVAEAAKDDDRVQVKEVQCFAKLLTIKTSDTPPNAFGLVNLVNNEWGWTSSRYMPYPYNPRDGREDIPKLRREVRVVRGGNNNTETCLGYTALRGYGYAGTLEEYQSTYNVRFVMEN